MEQQEPGQPDDETREQPVSGPYGGPESDRPTEEGDDPAHAPASPTEDTAVIPAGSAGQSERPAKKRTFPGRSWVAAGTAAAVVAALGGGAVGYALGEAGHPQASETITSGPQHARHLPHGNGHHYGHQNPWSRLGIPKWAQPPSGFGQQSSPFGSPPGLGGFSAQPQNTTRASAAQRSGLVRISTNLQYQGARAAGTGLILTPSGEVVTNHHVVAGATTIKATVMSTGKTYAARVIGTDASDDVAVIQLVGASSLPTVRTNTATATVGDRVTAVGDAGGTGGLTAAGGKVLALNRNISTQSDGLDVGEQLTGMIEISSDVIPGDSGGATYDANGQVIGMTTAASAGPSDITGYAIPIVKVLRIAGDLENGVHNTKYAYGRPAFLGVGLRGTNTLISEVFAGTPAAKAGITPGSTIDAVGSTPVHTATQLRNAVSAHAIGSPVSITWTDHSGTRHTATVTLTTGPVR